MLVTLRSKNLEFNLELEKCYEEFVFGRTNKVFLITFEASDASFTTDLSL